MAVVVCGAQGTGIASHALIVGLPESRDALVSIVQGCVFGVPSVACRSSVSAAKLVHAVLARRLGSQL